MSQESRYRFRFTAYVFSHFTILSFVSVVSIFHADSFVILCILYMHVYVCVVSISPICFAFLSFPVTLIYGIDDFIWNDASFLWQNIKLKLCYLQASIALMLHLQHFIFFCMKCNHVVHWTMSIEPLLFLHCNVVNLSMKLSSLKSTHHCSYLKVSIFHLLWFWWKILDFKIECLDILTYYDNRQNVYIRTHTYI